ncbi:MAG: hypothetical protein ACRD3G_11090 [Vicinamibacterales bacterium]
MGPGTLAIATLRLQSAEADSAALRLRAARELQAADLIPPALPPSAVLIVRRVSDPLPGGFGGERIRPSPQWEAAVRQALAAAASRAARPDGMGRITGTPAAVRFADEAEMIACLICDIARGEASGRWWWRSVLPRLGLPVTAIEQSVRDPAVALIAQPRETPAALTIASRWGQAAAVASRIGRSRALAVVAALARTHQIPDDIAVPPATMDGRHDDEITGGQAVRAFVPVESSVAAIDATAPWCPWLPPELATERIAHEVRCLFGVALGTYAAPARLRSAAAAAQGRRWWIERVAAPAATPPTPAWREVPGAPPGASRGAVDSRRPGTERRDGITAATVAAPPFDSRVNASPHVRRDLAPAGSVPNDVPLSPATPALLPDDVAPGRARRVAPSPEGGARDAAAPDSGRAHAAAVDAQREARDRDAQASSADAAADEAAAAAAALFPGKTVHTRLGGVLYLVHALENLGLPAAFEEQWALASAGGPWGTLDVLARALLGRRYASFADDPLWRLLPRLAAWSTPRRTGIDPPYRIPADWVSLLDAGDRYAWAERGGRVWVWSTGGYLVAHRACRGDGAVAVRRELSRVLGWDAPPPLLRRRPESSIPWRPLPELPKGCPQRIGRLAAAMAPAVRRRLLLALGIDPLTRGGASDRRIADILLLPAQLHVSSSHVDLVTRLDRVDLGARRAGLDRDPGWLPAYGRVIYFHFT